jgi:hypothetical protein
MEESVSVSQNSWLQDAMKKGLILAIIHIVVFLIIYFFFTNKLTGLSYLFFIIVFNMVYTYINGKQWRNEIGGYIEFGDAFKYAFLLLVTSGVIQAIFSAVFLFVEPSFPDVMAQSQLDTSLYWAQKFGAPDETLEKITETYNPEDITKRFTFTGQLLGFGLALLFYALGAAIVALVVRRREPVVF